MGRIIEHRTEINDYVKFAHSFRRDEFQNEWQKLERNVLDKNYTFEALGLVANKNDPLLSNIAILAARLLNTPISLISVIQMGLDQQYISAACGVSLKDESKRQVPLDQSISKIVYNENKPLVIYNLLNDHRTMNMKSVRDFGLRSYIGVPIHTVSGRIIGALCCIRTEPTEWTPENVDSLQRLATEINDIIKTRAHALKFHGTNIKLKKLLATRSSFSAHLTHEIRTPLTGLIGSIKLLRSMNFDGQAGTLVELMNRSATGLLKIVNDNLDFSKLDGGHFKLVLEPCDIGEIAREVVDAHRALANEKGVAVKVDDQLGEMHYLVDKKALRSILQNLFSNAIKFTGTGRAEIFLFKGQYRLIEIKVVDTGIGIPSASHESIFDEFQQADPQISRVYGGTGLGMAIVKRLVEEMQGDINLVSEVGKGSTFSISLPLKPATHSG